MTIARSARRVAACAAVLVALAGCSAEEASPSASPSPSPVAQVPSSGVHAIECVPTEGRGSAHVLLANEEYRLGGWNHINGVGSFATVNQDLSAYRIGAANLAEDATCGGARTFSAVLVKKTYDWDRQHANGIETVFHTEGITFGDVTDVTLWLRIDPARTVIPDAAALDAAYGDVLTAEQLAKLDAGNVNLEITLFGTGATASEPFMNAGTIISVDPAKYGGEWVRVTVTREDLAWYTEDNYVRTEVTAADHQELVVGGLRINPETENGLVARHSIGDGFDPAAQPELFKEMGIVFALVEVGRTGGTE